jgi:hypothetical protein
MLEYISNRKNYGNISPIFSIKTNNWKQRALIDVIYVSVHLLILAGDQSETEKFECCCKKIDRLYFAIQKSLYFKYYQLLIENNIFSWASYNDIHHIEDDAFSKSINVSYM